ncbi:MAG: hypothetical protein M3Q27_15230 [Actinomycetota bacterium]|nr:hypothetical protein [Actinomycetota bacterium]
MTTPTDGGSELPDTAMATGNDEGEPGLRDTVAPDDVVGAAIEDDAPLPAEYAPGDGGGPQNDGLQPAFKEP